MDSAAAGALAPAAVCYEDGIMKRLALIAAALLLATPALAQSPIRDRLAKAGQAELIAGDGPTYRAIVGEGDILLLTVAGDGRATLTITTKAGKSEGKSVSNRTLDNLDAALTAAGFNGEAPLMAQGCKPGGEIVFETLIEGRYRYGVQCDTDPLSKAVAILRGG
jgi:hypothetical protein